MISTTSRMRPFRIDFAESAIADLHRRIDSTRWPVVPFATGWSAGTDDGVLRDLAAYWRSQFNWFDVQTKLNGFAHLRGPADDPEGALHCVVIEPGEQQGDVSTLPLLLLHGWPGSFIELLAAGKLLASGAGGGPAFNVVIPSLPGFGFSAAPPKPGMHPGRIAERMHDLMGTLGHHRYGVQGGDWGATVGGRLAVSHPEAVAGLHVNFPPFQSAPAAAGESAELSKWREWLADWRRREGGYSAVQDTKPQTLAYALTDSPVGLLAWILEKFWTWSDHRGDLWRVFERDDVLANVTLYWLTETVLSASRTYYERAREGQLGALERIEVPTAYARFPGEPWGPTRSVIEDRCNLVQWSEPRRGGHFAGLEQPQLLAGDVSTFFQAIS